MSKQLPLTHTMYSPTFEHAACGMGFIAQVDGQASHELVEQGLTMLQRMNHRGGTGAEPDTGDGAGILMALPDDFFRQTFAKQSLTLPAAGDYAVAQLFLAHDSSERAAVLDSAKQQIQLNGFTVLGERTVPFIFENCGPGAQQSMPGFVQLIIERPADVQPGRPFEDQLYFLRRDLEKAFDRSSLSICSLSSQTIVYKGQLHAYQVGLFYPDLHDPNLKSAICLIHSRFSTNTFPSWDRAQPYRFLAHNGEINTLKGAENWMTSHGIAIYDEAASDSAKLENCMEYLYRHGRTIPEALLMLVPEAFEANPKLSAAQRAFDEYHASFVTPWDGPAALCFTDGIQVGAYLDRNGLRPSRFTLTKDNLLVVASESGVVDIDPGDIQEKGILGPAEMLLVDTHEGRLYRSDELKAKYANQYPYEQWLAANLLPLEALPDVKPEPELSEAALQDLWLRNGYTQEVIETDLIPMAQDGHEPTVAMGFDSPLAVLSHHSQSLFTYFKQAFAQVTNPPIDPIREKDVISTALYLGRDDDVTQTTAKNCQKLRIRQPILSDLDYAKVLGLDLPTLKVTKIPLAYDLTETPNRLMHALDHLFTRAENAINDGSTILVLSDRPVGQNQLSIPILLAVSGLHNYLVSQGKAAAVSLVADTAEACEIHHFACLLGYGAAAIHPYGAFATLKQRRMGDLIDNYCKAGTAGIIKIMSRMGISTIAGYQGAQLFEAIGLSESLVNQYFTGTMSRIGGLTLDQLETEYLAKYRVTTSTHKSDDLPSGGSFQFKADGEYHLYHPESVYQFQKAVRTGDYQAYQAYATAMNQRAQADPTTLRDTWELVTSNRPAVPINEVEPVSSIVTHFKSGAMSFGALSQEAHETIAIAMNSIGAMSNSGEGGEAASRFKTGPDGLNRNSRIKQVSTARFGVNTEYLMSADEIQIKMAQGAKPGEGGQLPANKAYPWVANIRGSIAGVQLISPPPHHDIYSIEDLAQLIYDLKQVNPYAKINVKLVSSTGVGTIAAGVVKAGADTVVISGYDGGTGAAPRNSTRDCGLPWEMGLAEAHQTLAMNRLRQRTTLEVDGKLLTGRDIAIAAMLGAESFSFATLTMIAIGCVMMRKCNLNTCPIGIATQNPELRKLFAGKPEHVVNMMHFLAQDLREIMAKLGYRTLNELVGHGEHLKARYFPSGKAKNLNYDRIIDKTLPIERKVDDPFKPKTNWPALDQMSAAYLSSGKSVTMNLPIGNVDRAAGTRIGGWVASHFGNHTLKPGLLNYHYTGIAGQSFGAFITQGLELTLTGEANDYAGKGLSGGRIIIAAPKNAENLYAHSPIVGNVACFGATSGEAYFNGRAGERFAVRNSGATIVVEGIGNNGCEYMTGGTAVILGRVGRNFAAGMSGGIAYVYDWANDFTENCNQELVDLLPLTDSTDETHLKAIISDHYRYTNSSQAAKILTNWDTEKRHFIKVYPRDYHRMLDYIQQFRQAGLATDAAVQEAFNAATGQN
ncbi:NADPH-dependent glutamate synthase (large subunit) [Secundilactobacillus kimchicus JCM 15530]|uniref:NADPH-dependent glutamate synthase (Large subunit) n=1 Tax=Secundilactobacillus kimchicus JCM 15530 TaxID=1302272 RepID=A0A0R1HPS6_9LACO|nr:glutamate synthase large subunit [Secundilactobacillus kimchicus]KRK48431.1 NADPH-dependent glutamate synthase (large subunit) [Secundilactobacillus kimchicus JCM 15530]